MTRVAFFDVDTQFDFMDPAGALYVPGAETLRGNLRKLTAFAGRRRIPVVASADAHPPDDPEFKVFPPHCLKGSPGARRIPETRIGGAAVVEAGAPFHRLPPLRRPARVVIEKCVYNVFTNPAADRVVRSVGARDWVVYGVATDYCVRAAAMGLRKRGYGVTVVEDAIRAVAPDTGAKALAELRASGCGFILTDVLLKTLEAATPRNAGRACRRPTRAPSARRKSARGGGRKPGRRS